ncbi:RCC1-like domain-containing protein [Bartonella rattaustraliani]|uniref:RCC1-like domain-containing protein n=1 Tax=Bartonella rattaustraliani TaxID=481139 RepID=UPI000A01AE98
MYSWGYNNYDQLGHGDTVTRAIAKRIDDFVKNKIKIARIILGQPNYYDYGVAYFLTTDGRIYACGYGGNGNLGTGTTSHQYTPTCSLWRIRKYYGCWYLELSL